MYVHTYEYKYILHTYVQCNKVRIGTYIYVHMYVSTYISARSTAIMYVGLGEIILREFCAQLAKVYAAQNIL